MPERLFELKEDGTNVKTEMLAGMTTFMTMARIICVRPVVMAKCGMGSPYLCGPLYSALRLSLIPI